MDQSGMDFSAYIADRTRDFTGRESVFAEINSVEQKATKVEDAMTGVRIDKL